MTRRRWLITIRLKKIYNYLFFKKYPFYKMYNVFDGRFLGYDISWYDQLEKGWRKAFGKKLSKELKKQLKADKELYTFRFVDIKEKYGELRFEHLGCSDALQNILDKYELLSRGYCQYCGKPARYTTNEGNSWIRYCCNKCFRDKANFHRLTVADLPIVKIYNDSSTFYITTYNIDFFKLWNINKADFLSYINNLYYNKKEINKEELEAYQKWFNLFICKKGKRNYD